MFDKTMSDWLDTLDGDKPAADGAWANAWTPVWEDAQPAKTTGHAGIPMRFFGQATAVKDASLKLGGTITHG